jgi:hypothetical protein
MGFNQGLNAHQCTHGINHHHNMKYVNLTVQSY